MVYWTWSLRQLSKEIMAHSDAIRSLHDEATNAYIDETITTAKSALEAELADSKEQIVKLVSEAATVANSFTASKAKVTELEESLRAAYTRQTALEAEIEKLKAAAAVTPTTPPAPVTPPAVVRKDNGYPWVDWKDLALPGDDLDAGLRRLTTRKNVRFPAGLFEFSNFKHGVYEPSGQGYGVYAPLCMGIAGAGIDKTVFQMRPMTSTRAAWVPAQSTGRTNQMSVFRLGGEPTDQIVCWGFTLSMTEQGHLYNGWIHYQGTGSHVSDVVVSGGAGDWNAPPGETFINNGYRDKDLTLERVETDGFIYVWSKNADGTLTKVKGRRSGGSPFGNNASQNQRLLNCNFHDSYVSGLTSSFTGVPDTGASPNGWYTEDCKMVRNAHHVSGGGKGFSGVNHEGTKGPVRHIRPFIDMIANAGQSGHMTFGSAQTDNPDIEIHDPTWTTSPDWGNGCFAIQMAEKYWTGSNKQTTVPKVFIGGQRLTPVLWWDNQPKPTGLNPKTQFVVKRT